MFIIEARAKGPKEAKGTAWTILTGYTHKGLGTREYKTRDKDPIEVARINILHLPIRSARIPSGIRNRIVARADVAMIRPSSIFEAPRSTR